VARYCGAGVAVRHIQLSNDFNAWRSWSRHKNRKQNLEHNRPCKLVPYRATVAMYHNRVRVEIGVSRNTQRFSVSVREYK